MQNTDPNVPQGLDPTAFYLTKAIKQTETEGSQNQYTATGKSGEYGAYQYTPDTWNTDSEKYLGQSIPLDKATPEQQNQVAYSKVADLLKAGNSQSQVASIWNSGYSDPSIIGTGTNKYGVQYDVPGYVNKVKKNYLSYANGSESPNTPAQNSDGSVTSYTPPPGTPIPTPSSSTTSQPGILQSAVQGIASPITKGISSLAGIGAGLIGDTQDQQNITNNGINYGYFGNQKPVGAGFDVTKDPVANAGSLADVASTGATGAADLEGGSALASGVAGLLGIQGAGDALASAAANTAFTSYLEPGESISDLSAADKYNAISNALKDTTSYTPAEQNTLTKALAEAEKLKNAEAGIGSFSELNPKIAKVGGGLWKAIKLGTGVAVGADVLGKIEGVVKGLL